MSDVVVNHWVLTDRIKKCILLLVVVTFYEYSSAVVSVVLKDMD